MKEEFEKIQAAMINLSKTQKILENNFEELKDELKAQKKLLDDLKVGIKEALEVNGSATANEVAIDDENIELIIKKILLDDKELQKSFEKIIFNTLEYQKRVEQSKEFVDKKIEYKKSLGRFKFGFKDILIWIAIVSVGIGVIYQIAFN